MLVKLNIAGFEGRELYYKTSGFVTGPKLVLDGVEIKDTKKRFNITDNNGNNVEIAVKMGPSLGLDPYPLLLINGEKYYLADPLKWYHYLWLCWPLILIPIGGACGGATGGLATGLNFLIFRRINNVPLRYLATLALSMFLVGILFVVITILELLMHPELLRTP